MLGVVPVVASDLRKMAGALPELASQHGLHLISASVDGTDALRAVLGPDQYDCDAFTRLAAACGARILYWDLDHFDLDEFAFPSGSEEDDEGVGWALAAGDGEDHGVPDVLRKRADALLVAARRRDGEVEAVRMAFVVEGVVHEWQVSAAWADDLHAQWEALSDDIEQARPAQSERDALDPAEVERIAGLLRKMPAIISAPAHSQRLEAAAEAFPAPDDDWHHRHLVRQALALAQQGIQQDADDAYRAIEEKLDDAAGRLLEQGVLDDVHDAPARRIVTADFLTAFTGGHRPKPRTVTLLLGRPAIKNFLVEQKAAAAQQAEQILPL
jgi:hypothetical protein